jgi:drug/metabolite transporter (DMT)-like permease
MTPLAPGIIALLLLAAAMHAGWNALVKAEKDRLAGLTAVVATGGIVGLGSLAFVPPLAIDAVPYLVASVVLHTVYAVLLVRSYESGDLSHVYPIARGVGPLVVALFSATLIGETLGASEAIGVALVSAGILGIAATGAGGERFEARPTAYAVATGVAIAAYTIVDGLGARQTPAALSYVAWLAALEAPWLLAIAFLRRGPSLWPALRGAGFRGAVGGIVATAGYAIAIWAFTRGAMANVAALRETSVLFASLIGTLWLGEGFGRRRVIAAALVVAGLLAMNLPRE